MPQPTIDTVTRPRSAGYTLRLDDMFLRLAPGPGRVMEQTFDQLQAAVVNTAASPEEAVAEFGQVYARDDFTAGEGLDKAHRPDLPPSALRRYWSSAGVDIRPPHGGSPATLTLLHAGERLYDDYSLGALAAFDLKLFARTSQDANKLAEISIPTGTPTVALTDPQAGEATSATTNVTDPVVLGEYLYVGVGTNGVHRRLRGTTSWVGWSDLRLDRLWSVKNRLIGAYQGILYEVRAGVAGNSLTLHTLGGVTGFGTVGRWDVVADVAEAILAAGSSIGGEVSVLHAFTPDNAGVLALTSQSTQPTREMVAALTSLHGVAVYTTLPSLETTLPGKLWTATLGEGAVLENIQLVKDFSAAGGEGGIGELSAGHHLTAVGTDVYIGSRDALSLRPRLWRLDIITSGVHRHVDFPNAPGVGGDESTDPAWSPWPLSAFGRLFVAEEGGLHRISNSTYTPSGFLIAPLASFGTASEKDWVGATLTTEPVPSGGEVELYYSTDPNALGDSSHPSWRRAKRITAGVDATESPLTSGASRELVVMIRLASSDEEATPAARGFAIRGFLSGSDMLLALPVDVSDRLERPGKARTRARGRGNALYTTLLKRQGSDAVVELFDLAVVLRGVVEGVDTPIVTRPVRGASTTVCRLRFRGRLVVAQPSLTATPGPLGTVVVGLPPTLGTT